VSDYSFLTAHQHKEGHLPFGPRRRRFEALTTDAKIIRLIRRRDAFFPTAAARVFRRRLRLNLSAANIPQLKLERLQVEHSTAVSF